MQLSRVFCLDSCLSPRGTGPWLGAAATLLALFASLALAQAPVPAPPAPAAAPASAPAVLPAAPARPQIVASAAAVPASRAASGRAASAAKANGKQPTKPLWRELKPAEQIALTPLANTWDTMSVAQKRKWLALSKNYPKLSPEEQVKVHSRMSEWAALSPQQRTQARLSFGATQQLSADDKKAKWEAYQALSPEEKSKLAARASNPPAAAPAVKPVPSDKLATIPKPKLGERPPKNSQAPAQPLPAPPVPGTTLPVSAPLPASPPAR